MLFCSTEPNFLTAGCSVGILLDARVARGCCVHRLLPLRLFTPLSAADNAVTTFVAWVYCRCHCPVRTIAF